MPGSTILIYDNGGEYADRYTAIFLDRPEQRKGFYEALTFNERPTRPSGIGQHCTCLLGPHLGKRIRLAALPAEARRFVMRNSNANANVNANANL